jgi:hypothetical protein
MQDMREKETEDSESMIGNCESTDARSEMILNGLCSDIVKVENCRVGRQ